MRFVAVAILIMFGSQAQSAEPFEKFCGEVAGWPAGSPIPDESKYVENKVGQPVKAKFVADKMSSPDWVLIDARSDADRSVGKVPKAVLMTSDSKDVAKHEFTKENIQKRLGDAFKAKGRAIASLDDLKGKQIAIFCNGSKCHRTSAAACTLRKMGFAYENIHLVLGGFNEWKESGLPVR